MKLTKKLSIPTISKNAFPLSYTFCKFWPIVKYLKKYVLLNFLFYQGKPKPNKLDRPWCFGPSPHATNLYLINNFLSLGLDAQVAVELLHSIKRDGQYAENLRQLRQHRFGRRQQPSAHPHPPVTAAVGTQQ
jgi:hypothetical protein